jgi:hypothetical protein
MTYNDFLTLVKQQNPEMPGKDQQKLASTKHKEFKASLKSQKTDVQPGAGENKGDKGPSIPETTENQITLTDLMQAEKRIRATGVDVNSVISIGREVIPNGQLIKHGKEGVNTLVSFEDPEGNKIPINGHFHIYF